MLYPSGHSRGDDGRALAKILRDLVEPFGAKSDDETITLVDLNQCNVTTRDFLNDLQVLGISKMVTPLVRVCLRDALMSPNNSYSTLSFKRLLTQVALFELFSWQKNCAYVMSKS
jgi:hypothetical protein